jgi:alpha-tubulin suppressor-like RCC1 family protein
VPGVSNAIAVAAGDDYTCAVLRDGRLLCWGDEPLGQGDMGRPVFPPRPVPIAGRALSVTAGGRHTCALLEDRTVQCWGHGFEGQLGDGLNKDSLAPVRVVTPEPGGETTPLEHVTAITAGSQHACALLENGKVYCWGSNAVGQLGRAMGPTAVRPVFSGLTDVVAVAAGGWHTCAIRAGGVTTCVGVMNPVEGDGNNRE